MTSIDNEQLKTPKIIVTDFAHSQLELMVENDPTLTGKKLRITISGKECDGFRYSVGFDQQNHNDLICELNRQGNYEIIMDPFAAFYLAQAQVEFIQDLETGDEGLVVTNLNQSNFEGKFWKKDATKTPPLKD